MMGGGVMLARAWEQFVRAGRAPASPGDPDVPGRRWNLVSPPTVRGARRIADEHAGREQAVSGSRPGAFHRQPLRRAAHGGPCRLPGRPEVHPHRHRSAPAWQGPLARPRHRGRREAGGGGIAPRGAGDDPDAHAQCLVQEGGQLTSAASGARWTSTKSRSSRSGCSRRSTISSTRTPSSSPPLASTRSGRGSSRRSKSRTRISAAARRVRSAGRCRPASA